MGNGNKEKEVENVNFLIYEELLESQVYLLKMLQEEPYSSEIK